MLKEKCCADRKFSRYICDMCKCDINKPIRIYVGIENEQSKKFRWHLCNRCFKKLSLAISNFSERRKANV